MPCCKGLDPSHKVMQWHMAEVKRAPQQARVFWHVGMPLRCRRWRSATMRSSTQFHCEFTPADGGNLVIDPGLRWTAWNGIWDRGAYPRLVAESFPLMPSMARMTRRIYDNLVDSDGPAGNSCQPASAARG